MRDSRSTSFGQRNNSSLSKSRDLGAISAFEQLGVVNQGSLREQGSLSHCVSCVRDTQCDCRRSVSQESSELRMVVGRRLLLMDLSVGGSPGGGLVHYSGEQQASRICVTSSRSTDWNRWGKIYLFPPWTLILKVLSQLRSFKGQVVLIAPRWPAQLVSAASVSGQIIPQNPQPLLHPEGGGSDLLEFCNLNLHLHA